MKTIIKGKRYDTGSARALGRFQHLGRNDFSYYSEELYQKRTGEFFLYGEGGPASRYSRSVGLNEWAGGEKIIPLTVEAAREWAEKNLDVDEYESIFGECAEDNSKKIVTYSLPVRTIEKIKRMAAEQGLNLSEVIERLVDQA